MTFEEQAAELHHLEREARSRGMSELAFELLALEVTRRGDAAEVSFEEQLAEIQRRIVGSLIHDAGASFDAAQSSGGQ
jgi:hypothetical protein